MLTRFSTLQVLGIWLLSRVGVFLVAWDLEGSGVSQILESRWDAREYLDVAANGYPAIWPIRKDVSGLLWAKFPLFPMMMRGVAEVLGSGLGSAGLTINAVLGALAAVLMFRWLSLRLERQGALAGVAFFSFWTQSYFFSYIYSEPLYLCLLLGALLLLDRPGERGDSLATLKLGGLGIGLGLVRPTGLLVGIGALGSVLWERSRDRRSAIGPMLALGAGAVLGYAAFAYGFCWLRTGVLGNCHTEAARVGWGHGASWLPAAYVGDWATVLASPSWLFRFVRVWELACVMVTPVLGYLAWRRRREWGLFPAWIALLPVLGQLNTWTLRSTPRFLGATPTLFLLLGGLGFQRPRVALGVGGVLLVIHLVSHAATVLGVWQSF